MAECNDMTRFLSDLLSFCHNKDDLAKNLMDTYKDVGRVFEAGQLSLNNVEGMNEKTVQFINLVGALSQRRLTDKYKIGKKYLQNELEEYIKSLFIGESIELLYLLIFDKSDKLAAVECISDGTVNSSGFSPRKMVDTVIKHNGKKVIIAHNHPHGLPNASDGDIIATGELKSVFLSAGILFVAHYVVAGTKISDCLPLCGD